VTGASDEAGLALGVGCTTDAPVEEVEALVRGTLAEAGLALENVRTVATVDRRLEHPAIVRLAARATAERVGYPMEELAAVDETTGVSEPAAILASNGGVLVVWKQKSAHATVAVARYGDGPRGELMCDKYEHQEDEGGIGPYLAIVVVAVVIGLGLAVYVVGYRDEIMAMLTQSPT
jgi:hypothetical protein